MLAQSMIEMDKLPHVEVETRRVLVIYNPAAGWVCPIGRYRPI